MAISRSWNTRFYSSSSNTTLYVDATEVSYSVTDNTSRVRVHAYIKSTSGSYVWDESGTGRYTVRINGVTKVNSAVLNFNIAPNGTKDLGTWEETVGHDADGGKDTNIYVSTSMAEGTSTINQTLTLTTIPRASKPTVSANSVALGSAVTIYFNRASTSFTHTVTYSFAGATGTITTKTNTANVSWTPPASLASQIPSKTSNGVTVTVETFNGTTSLGSNTVSFTLTVPNNATYNPTVTTPTASETNTAVSSNIGSVWVQNNSKIKLTATVSLKYGATLKSAVFKVGSISYIGTVSGTTATVTFTPTVSGTQAVTVTITDSRSRTATPATAGSLAITAYSKPVLTVQVNRNPANKLQIAITAKVTGSSLGSQNTLTMEAYVRTKGETDWGTKLTLPTGKSETSTTGTLDWGTVNFGTYAETSSFEVLVQAKDELTTYAQSVTEVGTTKVLMDVYKDVGIAFGKMYETAFADFLIQIAGKLMVDGSLTSTGTGTDIVLKVDPDEGNASLELGSTKVPSTPYLDFHSSGSTNDRDARIIVSGGTAGTNEQGLLAIAAGAFNYNGSPLIEYGTNANGEYLIFNSTGTAKKMMICRRSFTFNPSTADNYITFAQSYGHTNYAVFVSPTNNDYVNMTNVARFTPGPNNGYQIRWYRTTTGTSGTSASAVLITVGFM